MLRGINLPKGEDQDEAAETRVCWFAGGGCCSCFLREGGPQKPSLMSEFASQRSRWDQSVKIRGKLSPWWKRCWCLPQVPGQHWREEFPAAAGCSHLAKCSRAPCLWCLTTSHSTCCPHSVHILSYLVLFLVLFLWASCANTSTSALQWPWSCTSTSWPVGSLTTQYFGS